MTEPSIRALIVDDEPLARDSIRIALGREPDVSVVAECGDGWAAVQAIRDLAPDLVFLDVQMPELGGFDLIAAIGTDRMPATVFVTGHDEFALQAFDACALDYVLKPFDDGRFARAVERARTWLRAHSREELHVRLSRLLDAYEAKRNGAGTSPPGNGRGGLFARRLLVRKGDSYRFLTTREVDWLEAAGNYVNVHSGEESFRVRGPLSGILDQLDPAVFVRIHRSTVVNVGRIREVQPWFSGDYVAILDDGTQLRVSRGYRDDLLRPLA